MVIAATPATPARAESIRVAGIVQGVGLRPTVYRLARERGLSGTVRNDGGGVLIVVAGAAQGIDDFVHALQHEAPPLARIDRIERAAWSLPVGEGFRIERSQSDRVHTELSADAATCDACLAELNDPRNRRWRHAFANCTHCGPRFSIVSALPYDRARTSMAAFAMCAECEREYRDPGDRRFHAQPNACPTCGPRLRAEPAEAGDNALDALQQAAAWLRAGRIVAIKGIGGYHLACDASSEPAVARLRQRKRRLAKPFALMARDRAMIERYCSVSALERGLLQGAAAPIVLLVCDGPAKLAPSVAPRQDTLGFMLPYTPLHHLLMAQLDAPIVLTSGNVVDEPQCIGDNDARERLGSIADAFLLHDRVIVNRVDDSVLRVVANVPRVQRRARGLAPASLRLPPGFGEAPAVLALGGELKNTVCLLRGDQATLSPHIGDLENPRADSAFRDTMALLQRLFEHRPSIIAVDRHPDIRASCYGRERAAAEGLELVEVQHHHAHIAACLAEHGVPLDAAPVLGIALDGLGWGDDGTLWGGELLRVDYRGFQRLACLRPVPMPGGAQAIHEPWRMAWAYLSQHADSAALQREYRALPFFQALKGRPVQTLQAMQRAGINSPLTSSCGRLFDAVSALMGVCTEAEYEGQPAIELEATVDTAALGQGDGYAFELTPEHVDSAPLWPALLADLASNVPTGVIAARFHIGLAQAIVAMALRLTRRGGNPWLHRIALSGGVFQNAVLLVELTRRLEAEGFSVLSPSRVPTNDGGLSLGQAAVAAALSLSTTTEATACASAFPAK
jgi:hydrogenase maturation protein HypF